METHPSGENPLVNKDGLSRLELGRAGEDAAVRHLEQSGYQILTRGFRMFRGEIDIIARDGETLVFVEVKTRTSEDFGRPEDAVTRSKQAQIRKIAQGYLIRVNPGDVPCRFDVLAVERSPDGDWIFRHYQNAF
ncbi:MAG: YraN family protein [Acidobacteriota bacterium]|nr:YraN family protein [Acidobacteriota bacterium]